MEVPNNNITARETMGYEMKKKSIREYQFRIVYEDTDAGGVVYHARYLGIAERARTESVRKAGGRLADLINEHGYIVVVRQLEIQYRKPLFLDDLTTVTTTALTVLGASCWLSQVFRRGDEIVTEMKGQIVCLKKGEYTPVPFPPKWQRILGLLSEEE